MLYMFNMFFKILILIVHCVKNGLRIHSIFYPFSKAHIVKKDFFVANNLEVILYNFSGLAFAIL